VIAVDTSGWIEYFFDEENADIFAPLIEDTRHLIVPVICIYEVFKKSAWRQMKPKLFGLSHK